MALPPLKHAPSSYPAHPPLPHGFQYQVHYTRTEGFLPSVTGSGRLWYTVFWPAEKSPKGIVFFLHGLHEHSERFHHVLPQLAAKGYIAAAHDHIGHGRSDGLRGYVARFDDYVVDCESFISLVRHQISEPLPSFVWGTSMGGLLAGHVALRDSRKGHDAQLAGVIITAGALDVERTPLMAVQERVLPFVLWAIGRLRLVPAIRLEDMSSDPAEVLRMANDPLQQNDKVRANVGISIVRGMQHLMDHAQELQTPMLVIHGTMDKCTYAPGSAKLVQAAGSRDKELYMVEGAYHCLMHEPCAPQVLARMLAFLDRIAGTEATDSVAGPALRSKL